MEDIFSKRKTLRTIKADTSDYFIPLFHTLAVFLSTKETIITKRFLEHIMKNLIALTLLLGGSTLLCAQKPAKTPATYKPVKSEMYRKGWIDFNKNGVKDVYEDPSAPLEARIENLLQQMTLDEKTCQMVTLYGYKRVLKDDLPTPEWKELLWKDGIGAIDEHLNGFQQWGLPPSDNAYVWPASRHAWALNEVQRFFVEDTRLGIPVDFTNEGIRGVESYRATNFPTQLGLGHTWNRELIRQVGLITGREARMLGYTNVYAPILDVGSDQRWGRYEEVYGESPYLVAELVKEGGLSEEVINDRVRDILRVKFLIGLFDAPYQTDLADADREVEKEENEAIALQASRESIVLLKNAGELLPLDINSTKKIAICGPNANEEGYALTHYGPLAVEVTTVLEGIQEKTKGKAEVLYTKGCNLVDAHWPESEIIDYPLTDDEQAEIDKAVENAHQADVAIVVLGGGQRTCGENKSRTSLDLPGRQLQLLQAIQATGKPVVLILINGRPLSINWADKFVPAILEAWYPGSKGGTALADILFGDYNPGGKLTVTFPKTVGQIPFNFPCKPSSQIDGGKNPGSTGNMSRINGALYPFGYGLSYTTFEYSDLDITPRVITPNESATVRLKVTNTGKCAGDEVVQLYIRDVLSSITTYEKNLAGFQRIHLEPGETQELFFTIDRKHLELLDADMKWVVEPGDFVLMAGASSEDIRLNGTLTVEAYQTRAKAIEAQKPAKRVSASTNPEDAENVLDEKINTAWQGNKGDYITFALKNGAKVDKVAIAFTRDNNLPATFEIQLSGGGGQFLTVYSGTVSEYGKLISYPFKGTTASDLRIVLNDDRVSIAKVKF